MSSVDAVNFLLGAGILIVIVLFGIQFLQKMRTKLYRKDISNLYVAGKIRQIADKNGISIAEEYDAYKRWIRKGRIEDQNFDDTIEEDLQEQVYGDEKKGK